MYVKMNGGTMLESIEAQNKGFDEMDQIEKINNEMELVLSRD
jgi:hypothetical protein